MAFALGAGDSARGAAWNAAAAIDAVTSLADRVGMTHRLPDFGITAADFGAIASDALDDEVLANTPRSPTEADIRAMLASALHGARGAYRRIGGTCHGTGHPPRHPRHRRGIRGTYRGTGAPAAASEAPAAASPGTTAPSAPLAAAWPLPRPAPRGRTGQGLPGDDEPSGRRSRRACRLTR